MPRPGGFGVPRDRITDMASEDNFRQSALNYLERLNSSFTDGIFELIEELAIDLEKAWKKRSNVFICGNGGSAANALHMANDLHYGIGACGKGPKMHGLRVEALSANVGIVTCLANDTGYENIFANQIRVKGNRDDILIVLSGSGNSENVINAIRAAKKKNMRTYAIVAFDGGLCKDICEDVIHVEVDDMQVAEDSQLIIGHICMQWLNTHKPDKIKPLRHG